MILNVSLDEFVHCRHFYVPAFFLSYSPFLIYKKPCPTTHLHMAMASVVDHHYKRRLGWRRRRIAAHSSSIQTFLSDYYFRTSTATKKSTTKKMNFRLVSIERLCAYFLTYEKYVRIFIQNRSGN